MIFFSCCIIFKISNTENFQNWEDLFLKKEDVDVATKTKPINEQDTKHLAFVLLLKGSTHLFGCHPALKCYLKSKLYIAFPAPSISLMKIEWVVTMASANPGLKNVNALQRQEIPSIWSDL